MDYEALLRELPNNCLAWLGHYLSGPRRYESRESAIADVLDRYERLHDSDPRSGVLSRYFSMPSMADVLARGHG